MTSTTIATWLYAEREDEESFYPQVGGRPSSPWFQAVYWRCVAIFYATAARTSPEAHRVFWTNAPTIPDVDGYDLGAFLNELAVEVTTRPFTFQPPPGYYSAWQNQFYVLDLVEALGERLEPDAVGVLLDSDCVWTQTVDALAAAVREHGALTFDVGLEEDEMQNGLTRRDMGVIYADLGSPALRLSGLHRRRVGGCDGERLSIDRGGGPSGLGRDAAPSCSRGGHLQGGGPSSEFHLSPTWNPNGHGQSVHRPDLHQP